MTIDQKRHLQPEVLRKLMNCHGASNSKAIQDLITDECKYQVSELIKLREKAIGLESENVGLKEENVELKEENVELKEETVLLKQKISNLEQNNLKRDREELEDDNESRDTKKRRLEPINVDENLNIPKQNALNLKTKQDFIITADNLFQPTEKLLNNFIDAINLDKNPNREHEQTSTATIDSTNQKPSGYLKRSRDEDEKDIEERAAKIRKIEPQNSASHPTPVQDNLELNNSLNTMDIDYAFTF
jgi:hypothetical protein